MQVRAYYIWPKILFRCSLSYFPSKRTPRFDCNLILRRFFIKQTNLFNSGLIRHQICAGCSKLISHFGSRILYRDFTQIHVGKLFTTSAAFINSEFQNSQIDLTLSPKGRSCHFGKQNLDGHDKCGYRYLLFSVIPDRKHGQFQMILKPRTSSLRTIVLQYDSLPEKPPVRRKF